MKKNYAFAIIHFGDNIKYLELEIYFLIMLRLFTIHKIIYLYSINDTPISYINEIEKYVDEIIPYNDNNITYNVSYKSIYTHYNILRTCNFIFAFLLDKYNKICIIESDIVIMNNIDSIFKLKTPAIVNHHVGYANSIKNIKIKNDPIEIIKTCDGKTVPADHVNGGVFLIKPSKKKFKECLIKLPDVIKYNCSWANEALFEYIYPTYYNLPIIYNFTRYNLNVNIVKKYPFKFNEILMHHFNCTEYKPINIINDPIDNQNRNWLEILRTNKKYVLTKIPVFFFKSLVYDKNHVKINKILDNIKKKNNKYNITNNKLKKKIINFK